MSQEIADLTAPRAAPRFRIWQFGDRPFSPERPTTTNARVEYDRIRQQPRYGHFVRVPARIVRCLDYFEIQTDNVAVAEILTAYYLFIGVVDHAIDSGKTETAREVFNLLNGPARSERSNTDVAVVTERLRDHISSEIRNEVMSTLRELHAVVLEERLVESLEQYVDCRKTVGTLTADISYLLIRPLLRPEETRLRSFMQRVGAVGCLVDSVIDFGADRRRGLLSFAPSIRDHIKILRITLFEGLVFALNHPRLFGLFAQEVMDCIRDRFVTRSDSMSQVPG